MSKNWGVFDCETDSFDGQAVRPFIWGCLIDDYYFSTYSIVEFVNYIRDKKLLLYAHNGGKFDALFLSEFFTLNTPIQMVNGRVISVKIGECELRDSMMLLPGKLTIGKMEFDYSILDRYFLERREKNKKLIEQYLQQDCVALSAMLKTFFDFFGEGCMSLAGAALKYWESVGGIKRRATMSHDNTFRPYYFGGRVEALQTGKLKGVYNYFDIKSSYPAAMCTELPVGDISTYEIRQNISDIKPHSFIECWAVSDGLLPVRGLTGTFYPRDKIERLYFATGHEILVGLKTDSLKITKVNKILTSKNTENLKKYIDIFYEMKINAEKAGDKNTRELSKYGMNALSGKFGQNPDDYKNYFIVEAGDKKDGYSLAQEFDDFDIVQKDAFGQRFDVALSASITGYGRARLFEQAHKSCGVVYMDTDSIICLDTARNFDIGKNLGQWEHVAELKNLHIAGKKLYCGFDVLKKEWIAAHKGVSSADVNIADIKRAALGAEILIKKSAPNIKINGAQKFIARTIKRT